LKRLFSKKFISVFLVLMALIVTTFVLPCLPAQAAIGDPDCWGVIIGISNYQNISDTWYGADNAEAIYDEISPAWGTNNVQLLTNSEAKKSDILDAIAWLATKATSDDTVLFDFNGHGGSGPYLCTYDSLPYSWSNDISAAELALAFRAVHAGKIIIILDNCFAGNFKDELSANGRVILMGTSPGEIGWEYRSLHHFVYTYYVLQAFDLFSKINSTATAADVDTNNDYVLSAEEISNYADDLTTDFELDDYNPMPQHPTLYDGYAGDLAVLVKFMFKTNTYLPSGTDILTLDGVGYGQTVGPLIWAPGSTHTLSVVDIVAKGTDTRYVFTGWSDGDTETTKTVNYGLFTANYDKEFLLVIESVYANVTGAGWYKSGTTAAYSVIPLIETTDTKHIFTGWSGAATDTSVSGTLEMKTPLTLTANWRNEYLLTINSEYGEPTGAGWYKEGESAAIAVEPVQGIIVRQIFDGWTGSLTDTAATANVNMDAPKVITATWHTDFLQLYILIAVVVVLIAGAIVTVVLVRRHRAKANIV